jgi:hypothetical protein
MAGYTIGNIFFIATGESYNPTVSKKYLQAGTSGIYSIEIWTEEEILAKWPTAKPFKSLLDIKEVWNQQ